MGFDFLSVVVVLGLAILFHEIGHFVVAKLLGVKVLRFSVGFGPKLFGFKKGDTEYLMAAFPLGGYVKMDGDEWGEEHEFKPWEFLAQTPFRRNLIVIAGPVMNIILAYVLYFLIFALFGQTSISTTQIGVIEPGGPASLAGLKVGDTILSVNGKQTASWEDLTESLTDEEKSQFVCEVRSATGTFEITLGSEAKKMDTVRSFPPVVAFIIPNSPAGLIGMKPDDEVVSINDKPTKTWEDVRQSVMGLLSTDATGETVGMPFSIVWRTKSGEVRSATGVSQPEFSEEDKKMVARIGLSVRFPSIFSEPFYIYQIGIAPTLGAVIGNISRGSPAEKAGILPGSTVLSVNGVAVANWFELHEAISKCFEIDSAGAPKSQDIQINWLGPDQKIVSSTVKTKVNKQYQDVFSGQQVVTASIGVTPQLDKRYPGIFEAIYLAAKSLILNCITFVVIIYRLFSGAISPKVIGGPIEIIKMSAQYGRMDLATFFGFMAMINLNLAVVNLIPIPIVDGGHILIYTIEAIRRKRFTVRQMEIATYIGLGFLVPLIVWVFYNDLSRIEWSNLLKVFKR